MKSKRRQLTDDEIEREVLRTRDDPEAWEEVAVVPASSAPRPAWMLRRKHLELAARFHVLSILHRLGADANLALAQIDNVDITILGKTGQAVTIDVKTVEGAREWLVGPFNARKNHYVVVVEFAPADKMVMPPQTYVLSSQELQGFLRRRKLETVTLEILTAELAALEAWQQIISEQAA